MGKISSLIFGLLFVACVLSQKVRYNGHKVVRIQVNSQQELKRLQDILPLDVDIWSYDSNLVVGQNEIRVSPDLLSNITAHGFSSETWIEDVERHLNAHDAVLHSDLGAADDWYTSYHRYNEIYDHLRYLAGNHSSVATFVPSIGKTIEGRDIPAILIGKSTSPNKIFWNGGQHAREWVSPATVLYITEQLLIENAKGDPITSRLVSELQFVIVPIVNPDGYEYTWSKDRLWRKNRRPNTGGTYGVDLNRNWNIKWGGGGSSSNPSSDTYHGLSAFSEPETRALSNFISSFGARKFLAAIDFHSYSELILRPYGWTTTLCPDETKLKQYGAAMQSRIKATHGQVYDNIKSIELYITTGTASDWYYDQGIVGAYTIELRDKGRNGFKLPPSEILPTGQEIWAAVKDFTDAISK